MTYRTVRRRVEGPVCYLQLYRPEARNTINAELIEECRSVVAQCEKSSSVLVIEGLPEVFCFGADFNRMRSDIAAESDGSAAAPNPAAQLYALWETLACGSFVSIAHVRGQANAGGIGFVAACDIVVADEHARFSLSELLFGIYPACVLPFLARKMGLQKAHYMTITTQAVDVAQAHAWGLVDAYGPDSSGLVQGHLRRLRRLSKVAIGHYKEYVARLGLSLETTRPLAVERNSTMYHLPGVLEGIVRYVETGRFPWEQPAP